MAIERAFELTPSLNAEWISVQLRQTREIKTILEKNERFPIANFVDITKDFSRFEIEAYTFPL
ncbi:MAG: hypothetical protein HGA25_03115 [Clostridiales bacterium]|nr:hypothetical protein [Clostridiales bacterium]